MKNIRIFILSLLCIVGLSACMPEEYELGAVDVTAEELVEGLAFTVTQDASDPNTVYLQSLMNGYTPLWEHPQGKSQAESITLKIPFKGEYSVKFGVQTAGGYVYGEPYTFTLTTDNLSYVDDPVWNMISGGPGESKTWVLDLDSDGIARNFMGPLWFFTADYCWDNLHMPDGTTYLDGAAWDPAAAIVPNLTDGAATWYWAADYAGNSWMSDQADFGTMTFDLVNGANVSVDQEAYGYGKSAGSYMVDATAHTLTFSGAWPVCPSSRYEEMTSSAPTRVFNILYLTDDFMQLLIPASGTCLNYISTDYRDNWTPPVAEEPKEPTLPEGWQDIVGTISQTAIEWKLSDQNPLDWCKLDGSRMNGWQTPDEYADWLGTPDPATYEGFSLTMDSADNSYKVVIPDGTEVEGTYTLDEKGVYTFDNGIPSFTLVGWASFATTAENQLRIMEIKTKNGIISEIWVGAKDPAKDEYMGYHLVANVGAGGSEDGSGDDSDLTPSYQGAPAYIGINSGDWGVQHFPTDPMTVAGLTDVTGFGTYTTTFAVPSVVNGLMTLVVDIYGYATVFGEDVLADTKVVVEKITIDGTDIEFNAANIVYGDLENKGNLRIELFNEWGSTKANQVIDPTTFVAESSIAVTYTLSSLSAD